MKGKLHSDDHHSRRRRYTLRASLRVALGAALCLLVMHMSVLASAQSYLRPIALNLSDVTLAEALSEINRLGGNIVNYKVEEVTPIQRRVTIEGTQTVQRAVEEALRNTPLSVVVQDDNLLVVPDRAREAQPAARVTITGRITDANGNPLVGAVVTARGERAGAITDVNGNYTLTVPRSVTGLQFSLVGFETQHRDYNGESVMNVALQVAITEIANVVVTGIFTRNAESFTGATSNFTREELQAVGVQNVFQALRNLDPSLNIMDNLVEGSNPNAILEMQIRGASSFPDVQGQYRFNPNQPLFIVDGFEARIETVMDMDMNRIESVTILKDAAAKAIYGSKAANGVVVIETVRLTPGELRINYTGSLSVSSPDLSSYNMCDAREKLELETILGLYDRAQPAQWINMQELYLRNLAAVRSGVNTDWLAQPVRTAVSNKHSVNVEAGDDKIRIGIDLGYNDIQGVMKQSLRRATNGAVNIVYRHRNLLFRNMITLNNTDTQDSPYGNYQQYVDLNPYWRMRDDNGNLISLLGHGPVFTAPVYNPMLDAVNGTRFSSNYFDVQNNSYLDWFINNRFKLTGRFSFAVENSRTEAFLPPTHSSFRQITPDSEDFFTRGSFRAGYGKYSTVGGDLNLSYNNSWGLHALYSNLVGNVRQMSGETHIYDAEGMPSERMDNILFARQYALHSKPYGSEMLDREVGFLLAANYSYDNRYLMDLSARRSASSQFGSNNKWGTFWSVGVGWNLHHEQFLRSSSVITRLKLRGSTGYTGSQDFNSWQAMLLYSYFLDSSYQGMIGAQLEALANPDLRWQQKYDWNAGLDMTLFGNLDMRVDLYRATTNNLLTDINIPPSLGFQTYKANLGEIRNTGIEFAANWRVFYNAANRSSLSLFVNGIHNRNEVAKISNSLRAINDQQIEESRRGNRPIVIFEEGQSLAAIWAVRSMGIDPASGKEIFVKKDGTLTDVWNSDDLVVCGDREPKLMGNFGFNAQWQGFTANVVLRYRLSGQIYNETLKNKVENARMNGNVDRRAFYDTWQKPGDVVLFRDVGDWNNPTRRSSRFVQDINTLDISSVSVGYDFYRFDFVRKLGMQRLQLRVNMNDVANFSTVRIERGTAYPFARTISGTIIANF
ncbi:MAG: SusC/RagA family TonB-linked outer membrane protein [Rikenellaceae bacterium]|nr:SusC/RagA family TonB-linked outer membrane protein [Rikenellaceae bacterium]MCL2692263.1 SusC/RagA family TonB-linked outer membrane protein [Rikenellaceae bacterium]